MENLTEVKEHTQLNSLKEFEYAKTRIMAGKVHTGEMIALRPVCENLGLNWSGVHQAIKRKSELSQLCVPVKAYGKDGKSYDMTCLPPDAFNEWLYDLIPSNYKSFNVELWEYYKKGLVVHLLMMLRTAMNHIVTTEEQNQHNEELKELTQKLVRLEEQEFKEKTELSELRKEIKNVKDHIKHHVSQNPNQLRLDY